MNNYLLSIDPSIKNTGFTLWEKNKCCNLGKCNKCLNYGNKYNFIWKPIFIYSSCFNKRKENSLSITNHLIDIIDKTRIITYADLDLIIERGTFHSKKWYWLWNSRTFKRFYCWTI